MMTVFDTGTEVRYPIMKLLFLSLLLPCSHVMCAAGRENPVIPHIGIKMCNAKCIQYQFCRIFLYDINALTCRLSHTNFQNGSAAAGYFIDSHDKLNFPAMACSLLTCRSTAMCLTNHQGRTVCAGGNTIPNILGKKCKTNAGCPVSNFVCFLGTCKCIPGFSFNSADNTCVRRCKVYGNESTLYAGLSIMAHNNRQFPVASWRNCSESCVKETAFNCISYDYLLIPPTCTLSRYSYMDVAPEKREKEIPLWNHGTRHCA